MHPVSEGNAYGGVPGEEAQGAEGPPWALLICAGAREKCPPRAALLGDLSPA